MTIKQNIQEAIENSNKMARKAYLANIGVYGYAYETAQERFNKVNEDSKQMFEKLVAQGEDLEAQIKEQSEETINKVESFLPENVREINVKIRKDLEAMREKMINALDLSVEEKKQPAKKRAAKKAA